MLSTRRVLVYSFLALCGVLYEVIHTRPDQVVLNASIGSLDPLGMTSLATTPCEDHQGLTEKNSEAKWKPVFLYPHIMGLIFAP